MLAPIGSSTSLTLSSPVKPKPGLDPELAKLQKELSACVNCDSAKTAKGKANIQAITGKINTIKARVEETNVIKAADQPITLLHGEYLKASSHQYEQVSLPIDKYQSLSKANYNYSVGNYLDMTV